MPEVKPSVSTAMPGFPSMPSGVQLITMSMSFGSGGATTMLTRSKAARSAAQTCSGAADIERHAGGVTRPLAGNCRSDSRTGAAGANDQDRRPATE